MIDTIDKFMQTIGWYDSPDQQVPTHEPAPSEAALSQSLCAICEQPLSLPCKSISMMYEVGPRRCYFYRVHSACFQGEGKAGEEKVWSAIDHFGMELPGRLV